jgi:hypothetical protein
MVLALSESYVKDAIATLALYLYSIGARKAPHRAL